MSNLTKKELVAELKNLGLKEDEDFNPKDTNDNLEELLEKKQAELEAKDEEATKEETEDEEENKIGEDPEKTQEDKKLGPQLKKNNYKYDGEGNIDIVRGNQYIRTYSEEVHGKDFKELAEGFINKNTDPKTEHCPYKMTNAENVKALSVSYSILMKSGKDKGKEVKKTAKFGGSIEEKEKALALAHEHNVSAYII